MKQGLELTGYVAQTKFLPKTVFITDLDDTLYNYMKEAFDLKDLIKLAVS